MLYDCVYIAIEMKWELKLSHFLATEYHLSIQAYFLNIWISITIYFLNAKQTDNPFCNFSENHYFEYFKEENN